MKSRSLAPHTQKEGGRDPWSLAPHMLVLVSQGPAPSEQEHFHRCGGPSLGGDKNAGGGPGPEGNVLM